MEDRSRRRPHSESEPPRFSNQRPILASPLGRSPREHDDDAAASRPPYEAGPRLASDPAQAASVHNPATEGIRRRNTTATQLHRIPSLVPRTTLAERTQGQFTLAGPDESPQLRTAHEPFVQPGYADLNPAYEQPANAKPVWSLAKPLPRVVRPGMVPTKKELFENRAGAELPAENSRKLSIDVDPNELEKGHIEPAVDLRKVSAQVADARAQRENNFIKTLLESEVVGGVTRLSRSSSTRSRPLVRPAAAPSSQLSAVPEVEPRPRVSSSAEKQQESTTRWPSLQDHHMDETNDFDTAHDEPVEGDISLETLGLDEAALPDDLHPLVQNLVEEEIHNNHTTWSVIRTQHRETLAEALGVFVQLTIGFCADLSVTVARAGNPNTTQWAWGFATMIAIYVSGGVSGAHLNPAITTMLWFYRGFPKRKIPGYFAAQIIAAFCAALAAYGVYYVSVQDYISTGNSAQDIINSFVTNQRSSYINVATALFNEFLGTAILTVAVLALGDDQNAPPGAGMNALIVGLVVCCLSMAFANQTGAAFNPSRDLGPRLALLALGYGRELFTNPYWIYGPIAGALMGSFTGAFLYDFMIFTGGESPVNYPLGRTRRSLYKSRVKWKRRLHIGSTEPDNKVG